MRPAFRTLYGEEALQNANSQRQPHLSLYRTHRFPVLTGSATGCMLGEDRREEPASKLGLNVPSVAVDSTASKNPDHVLTIQPFAGEVFRRLNERASNMKQ